MTVEGCDRDLAEPAFVVDPYPALAELRARAPVQWHEPSGRWLTFSHGAANAVLRERGLGRLWTDRTPIDRFEPFNLLHRHQMMENEPPSTGAFVGSSRSRSPAGTSSGCDHEWPRSRAACSTASSPPASTSSPTTPSRSRSR